MTGALFGLFATLLLVALNRRRRLAWRFAYSLALAFACFTKPLWLLIALGHFVWAASRRSLFGSILALEVLAAGAFALALFLPRYL
jgi:hypothetical protein